MSTFTKLYLVLGTGLLGLFALADTTGGLLRTFGPSGSVDTTSRQGYWYTYRKSTPVSSGGSSPGRSPGSGGYGGGGYSGGK